MLDVIVVPAMICRLFGQARVEMSRSLHSKGIHDELLLWRRHAGVVAASFVFNGNELTEKKTWLHMWKFSCKLRYVEDFLLAVWSHVVEGQVGILTSGCVDEWRRRSISLQGSQKQRCLSFSLEFHL